MPRKIIGGVFVSLDGVMQAPGGPNEDTRDGFPYGGWIAALFEEALGNQVDTLFTPPFDLLLGRRTYDIFAAHWPFAPPDEPIAAAFAKASKYVLTGSDQPLAWQGSHRLADIDALARLKAEDGPNLVIQGSSTLYPQLLERDLIDRIVLMTAPVIIGQGTRVFGDGTPARHFKLVEQRVSPGGFVMSSYEPDGPVETADFGIANQSAPEQDRQRRMREGSW